MKLPRWCLAPASESHLAMALGYSVVMMAGLLCALVWQAGVISYQQEIIRWLWTSAVK
jgi:hypothetical protein